MRTASLSADELFVQAGLTPTGAIVWGEETWKPGALPKAPGVYVISVGDMASIRFLDPFESAERSFWATDQEIVYIGRAENLSRRLRQFRRHKYGNPSPHKGGQAILLLDCLKLIRFAETPDFIKAEDDLIQAFERHAKRRPFGNKVKAATGKAVAEAMPDGVPT